VPQNQNDLLSHCQSQSARANLMKFFFLAGFFWKTVAR
jgi:hypothetical protein